MCMYRCPRCTYAEAYVHACKAGVSSVQREVDKIASGAALCEPGEGDDVVRILLAERTDMSAVSAVFAARGCLVAASPDSCHNSSYYNSVHDNSVDDLLPLAAFPHSYRGHSVHDHEAVFAAASPDRCCNSVGEHEAAAAASTASPASTHHQQARPSTHQARPSTTSPPSTSAAIAWRKSRMVGC